MKPAYKIFFAIPFDSAIYNLYDRISKKIRKVYPSVTTVIGNNEVGPSPEYSKIATFKAQNRELNNQFKKQIEESDIVIADLTNNNPNVHFELGIALYYDKNIFRVTGRSLTEIGFDIRNLEIHRYQNEKELELKIVNYLKIFFKIKNLPFHYNSPELYFKNQNPIEINSINPRPLSYLHIGNNKLQKIRDGGVKVEFEIMDAAGPEDWFGIYFRALNNPQMGSYLLYVRQNGSIEIASYFGNFEVIKKWQSNLKIEGKLELTVEIENEYLEVSIGGKKFNFDKLESQRLGKLILGIYNTNVKVYSIEIICRDTLEFS